MSMNVSVYLWSRYRADKARSDDRPYLNTDGLVYLLFTRTSSGFLEQRFSRENMFEVVCP